MVGAWMSGMPKNFPAEPEVFAHLFPRHGFKFRRIRSNADHLAFLHGSDDPYCPIEQAVTLATKLKAPMMIVPDGGHLGARYTELPQVWSIVEPYL
jgi:predicted alpha/beta hydrolase family esterase